MNNKMKLPKSLVMNKKMITKLQESQMANVVGGMGNAASCDKCSCNTSCDRKSCNVEKEERAATMG
jgi:hypothetical protein